MLRHIKRPATQDPTQLRMELTTRFQLTSQTLLLAYLVGSVHKLEPPRDERIGGICSPVGAILNIVGIELTWR